MTEKPNFFKLGIFILTAAALIVAGLILFGSGTFGKKKIYFETYFSESVHGLTQGSDVLLSGVKIGVVEKVTFVRNSYDLPRDEEGVSKYDQSIRVICSALEEELPAPEAKGRQQRIAVYVKRGFRLRMASNLITGQAYLEGVILDPKDFPAMEVAWKPQYPYIPSAPSVLSTMKDSVDRILKKIEELDLKAIIDNTNTALENINQAVIDANIKKLSANADAFIAELRQSNEALQKLIENPDPKKELANIPTLVDNFNQTISQLEHLITSETPEVQDIIENIRQLSENLSYLTERLKDNPSELIFSKPPPKQERK